MMQNSIASTLKAYSLIFDNQIENKVIRTAMINLWMRIAYQSAVIRVSLLKLKKKIDYTGDSAIVFDSVFNTQPQTKNQESVDELYDYYNTILKQITENMDKNIRTQIRERFNIIFRHSKLYKNLKDINFYISILYTVNTHE